MVNSNIKYALYTLKWVFTTTVINKCPHMYFKVRLYILECYWHSDKFVPFTEYFKSFTLVAMHDLGHKMHSISIIILCSQLLTESCTLSDKNSISYFYIWFLTKKYLNQITIFLLYIFVNLSQINVLIIFV